MPASGWVMCFQSLGQHAVRFAVCPNACYSDGTMARVNVVKRIKVDGRWIMRSIPRRESGNWDWNALPEGRYYVEWYDGGTRKREPAGTTASQALEVHRRRRHQLEAEELGYLSVPAQPVRTIERPLDALLKRYLEGIETPKKPNTHRKYESVLERFAVRFPKRSFESISIEEVNALLIDLMKHGMKANTVLHNAVIIAQFFKRHGRGGFLRELQLPERSTSLPREYTDADLTKFFGVCSDTECALFSTFLMTGFREQEIMYLSGVTSDSICIPPGSPPSARMVSLPSVARSARSRSLQSSSSC